jgi:hypothetical protein
MMGALLFLLRLVSFIVLLFITTLLFLVGAKNIPLPLLCRIGLHLLGFEIGPSVGTMDPTCRVVISNHPGMHMDGLIWIATLPKTCSYLARKDTAQLVRWVVHMVASQLSIVFVSRAEKENTVERMKQFLEENPDKSIMIAPEGSYATAAGIIGTDLYPFRTGGFRLSDRVQPMLIVSETSVPDVPQEAKDFISYMWRHRSDPPTILRTVYLHPMTRLEDESVEDFVERVRSSMQLFINNWHARKI